MNEWENQKLGDHVDLKTGFPFKSSGYVEHGIKLLRGDNIVQGDLRWEDVKCWPLEHRNEYEEYELRDTDVVLAMDRPWIEAGLKYAAISIFYLPCLLLQRSQTKRH